jgi:capsular exopolysaccharide synthesis family protein
MESLEGNQRDIPANSLQLTVQARTTEPPLPARIGTEGARQTLDESQRSGAKSTASALSAEALLKAFRLHWLLALFVGLVLGSVGAIAGWNLVPARYMAYAHLTVVPSAPSLLSDAREVPMTDATFEKTQTTKVKSRKLVRAALDRFKVNELHSLKDQPEPIEWLQANLSVGFIEKTNLLQIALSGINHPEELEKLVNAVAAAYCSESEKENLKQLQNLENLLEQSEDDIRKQRESLGQMALKTGNGDAQADMQKQKEMEHGALMVELLKVQSEVLKQQTILAAKKARLKLGSVVPEHLVEASLDALPSVQPYVLLLSQGQADLVSKKEQLAADSQLIARALDKVDAAQAKLKEARAKARPEAKRILEAKARVELKAEIDRIEDELKTQKSLETELDRKVKACKAETGKNGANARALEPKRAEIEDATSVLRQLRLHRDRVRLESRSFEQRVAIFEPAEVPQTKVTKSQTRATILGGLAGLCIGIFGVSFWEARAMRINTAEEIINDLNIKVIGVIPSLSGAPRTRVSAQTGSARLESLLIESVDRIRTMLLCATRSQAYRVLMVTSASPREGKSTLASHLAISMARCRKRTLLIDADLRRPKLHELFDIPSGPGFAEVLRGESELPNTVQVGPVDELFILAAGNRPHLSIPLLPTDECRSFFERARASYDFVIVDSSPILPVSDALWLGKEVDAVVLSVVSNLSRLAYVHAACERLQEIGVVVLGTVVSGVRDAYTAEDYQYVVQPRAYPTVHPSLPQPDSRSGPMSHQT